MNDLVVGIPEQPFLLLLWMMACFSLVFIFILELLVTIWVIAEIRVRLHRLKVQKRKQLAELQRLEQQTTSTRPQSVAPPVQQQAVTRHPRRSSNFDQI